MGALPLNRSMGGMNKQGLPTGTPAHGVSSVDGTHRGTLELISCIGGKTWRFLLDLGLTENYTSTQTCTTHGLRVREDPKLNQVTMVGGSITQIEGWALLNFKYVEYWETIKAKIFPVL